LSIGGDTESNQGAGIYLHIIWPESIGENQQFWLYVGQSINLQQRISDHQDAEYRRTHKALHYSVWDSEKLDNIQSAFVTLSTFTGYDHDILQYLQNLQEMWMSCIFQTLRVIDLDKFMPEKARRLWAGQHLNIALPLWQSFTNDLGSNGEISIPCQLLLATIYTSNFS
jgi:hypothetical protein